MIPADFPQPRAKVEVDLWPSVTHRACQRIPSPDDGLSDAEVDTSDGVHLDCWTIAVGLSGLIWLSVGVAAWMGWL